MSGKPLIQKVRQITGKTLIFRDASVNDAAFILSLRTNRQKARYLSPTSPDMIKQIAWLEDYKIKNDQAYFIIEDRKKERLGTVRIYDQKGDSFCWGSWILKDNAPKNAGVESALIVYAYAVDYLGFKRAHFDVRKGNKTVWQFHERCGAVRIGETDEDYLYQIEEEKISFLRFRYKKYLQEPLIIN